MTTQKQTMEATLGDLWSPAAVQLVDRASGKETPIRTPWPTLNAALAGGLWPGKVVVITGNTGSGKTQLALSLAMEAAKAGHPVGYVGMEIEAAELVARLTALEVRSGDPASKLQWSELLTPAPGRGAAASETLERVKPALVPLPWRQVLALPGWNPSPRVELVKDLSGRSLGTERQGALADLARKLGKGPQGQAPVVVVDYLQQIGGDAKDLRERIGAAATAAHTAAMLSNAAVILLSSTPRSNYWTLWGIKKNQNTGAEAPMPFDGMEPEGLVGLGKESGEIEYSADLALVMCRKRRKDGPEPPVHLAIAKNRTGRPGWVVLDFDGTEFKDQKAAAGKLVAKAGKEGGHGGKPPIG